MKKPEDAREHPFRSFYEKDFFFRYVNELILGAIYALYVRTYHTEIAKQLLDVWVGIIKIIIEFISNTHRKIEQVNSTAFVNILFCQKTINQLLNN
jgi:hypothetical protein